MSIKQLGQIFSLLCLLTSGASAAQISQSQGVPGLRVRTAADSAIVLDAVSPKGQKSLAPSELVLTDDDKRVPPQNIRAIGEYSSDSAAQLILVLDTINSSQQEFVRAQAAVSSFLREAGGKLHQPTSVVFLSVSLQKALPNRAPTTRESALLQGRQLSVHRLAATMNGITLAQDCEEYANSITGTPESSSLTDVSDRVRLSLEALSFLARAESIVPGAKVTLWLSPGWPYLERSEAKSSAHLFDSVVYFNDALRSGRLLLYMVDPQGVTEQASADTNAFQPANGATLRVPVINTAIGRDFYKGYLKGLRRPEEANPNDLTLQVLAIQSGGLVVQQDNDIKGMIDRCAGDVGRLTGVSFIPEKTSSQTSFHNVQIKSTHPAETLRARTGFYLR